MIKRYQLHLLPILLISSIAIPLAHSQTDRAISFMPWPKAALAVAEFTDIEGRTIGAGSLWLQTPEDIDSRALDAPLFQEKIKPERIAFDSLAHAVVQVPRAEVIAPIAREVDCYVLGKAGSAAPPPPNWKTMLERRPDWDPAAEVDPGALTPYVEHGQFFWAAPPQEEERREVLFHHGFQLSRAGEIGRATLCIAGRAELIEAAVNGHSLHLAGRREVGLVEFEITALLREGTNAVAFWTRSPAGTPAKKPVLTFHIELERTAGEPVSPLVSEDARQGALLLMRAGDRIWGDLKAISASGIELNTAFGDYRAKWEGVEALLMPGGYEAALGGGRKGMLARIEAARGKTSVVGVELFGLPLTADQVGGGSLILLTGGRTISAEPDAINGAALRLRGRGAEAKEDVPVAELLAIYPQAVEGGRIEKPSPEALPLYCAASTRRGERISGILRQAGRRGVILEARGEGFLKIAPRDLTRLDFTQHRLAREIVRQGRTPPPRLGFIGRPEGINKQADEKARSLATELQAAAFLAGIDCDPVPQSSLTETGALRRDFTAIALLDPLGEYADTLRDAGDARQALSGFVDAGGTLLLYSRGGALRGPLKGEGGGWVKMEGEAGLAGALGLRITNPGDEARPGLAPFERPPRESGEIFAILDPGAESKLKLLPSRLRVGGMTGAIFYPLTAAEGAAAGRVLYVLQANSPPQLGPALAVFSRGQGRVVVIDHLLWRATADELPFTESVLPLLLRWLDEPLGE